MQTDSGNGALTYLTLDDAALEAQCEVDRYRARGPGGQKRNKTSSAVRLRHQPTGLSVVATEDRSQHVNRRRAMRRLREAIALHVRCPVDLNDYQRSTLVAECFGRDGRLAMSRRDSRYFCLASEVLDVLIACDAQVAKTAGHLGLSTAALVKLMRGDPKLWKRVNEMRAAEGIKPLR